MIHLEGGDFSIARGNLTPFGEMVKEFHDFTARHKDRGETIRTHGGDARFLPRFRAQVLVYLSSKTPSGTARSRILTAIT